MEPLSTNGIDPALLSVVEKRGHEREPAPRRKRPAAPGSTTGDENAGTETISDSSNDDQLVADATGEAESPRHVLDDLA